MMIASCCRRALLGVSFGAFATLSALPAHADQITFVSQGGAYQKAQTIAILDPSAKKLGITINQDSIPAYVEGAKREGIDAVQFQNCEQLERELAARGITW